MTYLMWLVEQAEAGNTYGIRCVDGHMTLTRHGELIDQITEQVNQRQKHHLVAVFTMM